MAPISRRQELIPLFRIIANATVDSSQIRSSHGSKEGETRLPNVVAYGDLKTCDIIVDAVYEGGSVANVAADPLSKLLPGVGNQGGFRAAGRGDDKKLVVLYTSGEDVDWPDSLDLSTGQLIYYGDNKTPGHELHDTGPGGNRILRHVFDLLHGHSEGRRRIPPFFTFRKYPTATSGRSIQFLGIAVPGFRGLPATSDLVAVWKTSDNLRFQNYRATLTVLNIPVVRREWLNDISAGNPMSPSAPTAWVNWVTKGQYDALVSVPTTVIRSQIDQMPKTLEKTEILRAVWDHFRESPIAFEGFAARIFKMHDSRVIIDEITRGSVDGGRDAIGRYLLGFGEDPIYSTFALEAKCYAPPFAEVPGNSVGVKEVSRLISRIRHREFGVLVTTSVVGRQAYEEVRQDQHPIIFITAKDITEILTVNGYGSVDLVRELLDREFPVDSRSP